jgi:predicted ATPase
MEITSTHQGNFRLALEHFDKGLSLYNDDQDRDDAFVDAVNPGVAMRCFAGWSLWFIGRSDRAVIVVQEAVALARKLSEPHGLAHALLSAAVLHQLRREPRSARQYADEAVALSAGHGLGMYAAMAQILGGWALTGQGHDDDAAEQMRQGQAAWHSTGAQLMRPHSLALLTEASTSRPADDSVLRVLDEAIGLAESTGERWYHAELHRLKGERLLARARDTASIEAADACFERSLAIARAQEALSLELRAAMSLARLHRDRTGQAKSREQVVAIYKRFEEGFDTVDLREARALLDAR